MAMLLGLILLTACCSDRHDRNCTRYLIEGRRERERNRESETETERERQIGRYSQSSHTLHHS
jgi:hypothetical protein